MFRSQIVNPDPRQTLILAKRKNSSFLRTRERKTSMLQLKIFFLWKVDKYLNFQCKKCFLKCFTLTLWPFLSQSSISKNERIQAIWGLKKKTFIDAVENTFLRKVDTYLKLPLQKIFLKMFHCWAVTIDLSLTGYTKSDQNPRILRTNEIERLLIQLKVHT